MIWFRAVERTQEKGSIFRHSSGSVQRRPGEGSLARAKAGIMLGTGELAWGQVGGGWQGLLAVDGD